MVYALVTCGQNGYNHNVSTAHYLCWLSREDTAGKLLSFMVSTQMAQRSLGQMSLLLGHVIRGASAGGRVWHYMTLTPSIPIEGGIVLEHVQGDIAFNDVTFAYPSRPSQVCGMVGLDHPLNIMFLSRTTPLVVVLTQMGMYILCSVECAFII